jgi:hypothetical protein
VPRGPAKNVTEPGAVHTTNGIESSIVSPWEAATTAAAVPRLTTTHDEALSKEMSTWKKTIGRCRPRRPTGHAQHASHVALGGRRPSGTHTTRRGWLHRASTKIGAGGCWQGGCRACSPRKHAGTQTYEENNNGGTTMCMPVMRPGAHITTSAAPNSASAVDRGRHNISQPLSARRNPQTHKPAEGCKNGRRGKWGTARQTPT